MSIAHHLPGPLAVQTIEALIQLHDEGDQAAILSVVAALAETPPAMLPVMLPGLLQIAKASTAG